MTQHDDSPSRRRLRTRYSIEPRISSLTALPATLALKVSPMPRSEITSTGVRESMQESTMAAGYWPAELDFISARKSRSLSAPETNRALPFRKAVDHLLGRHGISLSFGQGRVPRALGAIAVPVSREGSCRGRARQESATVDTLRSRYRRPQHLHQPTRTRPAHRRESVDAMIVCSQRGARSTSLRCNGQSQPHAANFLGPTLREGAAAGRSTS